MNDNPDRMRATLMHVEWMAEAGASVVDELAAVSRWLTLRKGEALFSRGQMFERVAIIASGTIEATLSAVSGRHHLAAVMQCGQVIGFNPLFLDQPARLTHVALEPTEVVLIDGEAMLWLMQQSRALLLGVLREQARRNEHLQDLLGDRHLLSAKARIARLLQSRWYAPPAEGQPSPPEVRLTHQRLADLSSLQRQSVSAELEQLQALGLIRQRYGAIELFDAAGLEAIVDRES